jgi:hypothetical protein
VQPDHIKSAFFDAQISLGSKWRGLRLVDTVMGLQYADGGFNPRGNGGACEDVDCVDILVNLYKRVNYRRAEILHSLKRCVDRILTTQNEDGGFPYNRDASQSHMGIPATMAPANTSTTFATWFRIHTLALCAEVIPEYQALRGVEFCCSKTLSMGWHANPQAWKLVVGVGQRLHESVLRLQANLFQLRTGGRQLGGKVLRGAGLR